ncbi:MAG: acyl-CoA dehydrogenase [Gammaproteobacteria bacterium]|jgi:alkylation response protein AidB-like acyl-CoA dehydrogenase|nr:acyl-CoA dehydrogenase [Gammaproteobacteria bacterium]
MTDAKAKDTPEQAEFRTACRQWLSENHPGDPPVAIPQSALEINDRDALDWLKTWQKSAYEAGLVGCDYPKEVGGGGHNNCQAIANEELRKAATPYFPNISGLGMAAPAVFFHAREDVKAELLPRLFSCDDLWCQGFSEPGAGSDLANQQTFAERKGDGWLINGHKVWTSLAHFADWMILLCRTDRDDKYNGMSYFVVPFAGAVGNGITVRPLIKMTGGTGFNEVIMEDLFVEDRYRLDEVGAGWKVAMTTLTHERGAAGLVTPAAGGMSLEKEEGANTATALALIELAGLSYRNGKTAADDPLIRDQIVQLLIREEAFKQNQRRLGVGELQDQPDRLALQFKVTGSELGQDRTALAYDIEGSASSLYVSDEQAPVGGQWPLAYMNSFGSTIAAGTSEIQRNILGERVLGLPKSK